MEANNRRRPCRPDRRAWTLMEDDIVRATFPYVHNQVLAERLGRSEPAIVNRAAKLGVRKAPEYLAECNTRFKPGHKPHNAGHKGWQAGGRSVQTQFRKGQMAGQAARNYKPIGSLRINADGYLERKVTDAHPVPARRWVGVHRLVWESAHGQVPPGHVVRFRAGMFTQVLEEITLDRLELVSRAEHARRNNPVSRDPEYARLVQLKGAITRHVNRIIREHKESNA